MKSQFLFEQIESLRILHLYGDALTRAKNYGQLIKDGQIESGLIAFFCDAIDSALLELPRPARVAISKGYTLWADRMLRRGPGTSYAELRQLAEKSGIGWKSFSRALCAPDLGTFLAGIAQSSDAEHLPQFGCTSLFKANPNGSAVFGRNLDYSGVGVWDRRPLITVNHPLSSSHDRATVALGTDGVSFGSISGFNDAGLVLMLHQAYTKARFGLSAPLYSIGEMCLRSCKNLDEAIQFLDKHRPLSTWFFVLVSLKEKRAAVVESSRESFFVRPSAATPAFLSQTNHMHQPMRQKREVMTLPGRFNSEFRYEKACQLEHTDLLTSQDVRQLLAFQKRTDGHSETAVDVMKSQTIQTCLFESDLSGKMKLGISIDPAPAATGRIAWIDFDQLFQTDLQSTKSVSSIWPPYTEAQRQTQLHYSALYSAVMRGEGSRHFESLIGTETSGTTAKLLYAQLLWSESNFQRCREVCALAKSQSANRNTNEGSIFGTAPQLLASFEILEWLCLARMGESEAALELASKNFQSGIANPLLRRWTTQFLKTKKVPKETRKLAFNFFNGDLDLGQF